MTWDEAEKAVREMASLSDDWDGEGAYPIDFHVLLVALGVIAELDRADVRCPDCVLPTVNGAVCFEYTIDGQYSPLSVGLDDIGFVSIDFCYGGKCYVEENALLVLISKLEEEAERCAH